MSPHLAYQQHFAGYHGQHGPPRHDVLWQRLQQPSQPSPLYGHPRGATSWQPTGDWHAIPSGDGSRQFVPQRYPEWASRLYPKQNAAKVESTSLSRGSSRTAVLMTAANHVAPPGSRAGDTPPSGARPVFEGPRGIDASNRGGGSDEGGAGDVQDASDQAATKSLSREESNSSIEEGSEPADEAPASPRKRAPLKLYSVSATTHNDGQGSPKKMPNPDEPPASPPRSQEASMRTREAMLQRVRAAFEQSQLVPSDGSENEIGPHCLVTELVKVIPNMALDKTRFGRILLHLAQFGLEQDEYKLIQQILGLMAAMGAFGSVQDFALDLANSLVREPTESGMMLNSAMTVCPFPSWQHGVDTHTCPVVYMTLFQGRLVECEANDVFQSNVVETVEDDDNIFDILRYIFEEQDLPLVCEAVAQAYSNNGGECRTVLHFNTRVRPNAGWMMGKSSKMLTQAKLLFRLSSDGQWAAYSICMLPYDYGATKSLKRKIQRDAPAAV